MEFNKMKLVELKAYAKEKGIKGVSTLKKGELIARLMEFEQAADHKENISEQDRTPEKGTALKKEETSGKEKPSRKRRTPKKEELPEKKEISEKEKTPEREDISEKEKTAEREDISEKEKAPEKEARSEKEKNIFYDTKERILFSPEKEEHFEKEKAPESQDFLKEKEIREDREPQEKKEFQQDRTFQQDKGFQDKKRNFRDNRDSRDNRDNREFKNRPEHGRYDKDSSNNHFTRNRYNNSGNNSGDGNTNNVSEKNTNNFQGKTDLSSLDSGDKANGILEVMPDGFGFIRCENYLPGENDVYVAPSQIRRFNLKTGDIIVGNIRIKTQNEKYSALLYVESVNGYKPYEAAKRKNFEDLTPIFPNERIRLETEGCPPSMRMVDLLSPIGKGQRGMIVSQPKTGKTTLLKQIARSITSTQPKMKVIVLLIDERPEEVTDIRESIEGPNAEVIYSTFDEQPEHHQRVSEMVLARAKRLVEHKEDVVILLDSITRLARAYNLVVPPSGRTLSGGLDPAALYMPKKIFGAARNMREGGSLTILATALVETGSKMDDVVFEEFKGTGNMELVLDRKLAEKRIFPAINIQRSGTRRDDLLLSKEEQEIVYALHREMSGNRAEQNIEEILKMFKVTKTNEEFIRAMRQSILRK